jgi:hypothetical protein
MGALCGFAGWEFTGIRFTLLNKGNTGNTPPINVLDFKERLNA